MSAARFAPPKFGGENQSELPAEGAARLGGGLRKQRALGRLRHLGVRISLLMDAASDSF